MGLRNEYIEFIISNINKVHADYKNLKMIELGNQIIRKKYCTETISERTGKEYFSKLGFDHTSVDLNGRNGAVIKDLRKESQFHNWHLFFDILTNCGTTEHVEPHPAQFECFKIIHSIVKEGGLMLHIVPDIVERDERNKWTDHHTFYSSEFFEMLAMSCSYEILENKVIAGNRSVALKKTKNNDFLSDRDSFLKLITKRERL